MPLAGSLRDLDVDCSLIRDQLVKSAGEGSLHLFERLLLRGKAQVVGVYETVGDNWKWLDRFLTSAVRLILLSAIRLESVWNLLLFKAVIGWPEAFDHFMMDVIQARDFAVFEEIFGISKVLDGERCQDGFMAVGF